MQLIQPALVVATRNLISAQGGNPYMINDDGSVNPEGVISLFFNEVEIKTNLTPTLRFPIGPTGVPTDATADALIKSLQPSVTFHGPAGQVIVAPYGQAAGGNSWLPLAAVGLAVAALAGWLVFGGK